MLTLKNIKELSTFTSDSEVIKAALEIKNEDFNDVKRLYQNILLKTYYLKVPKSYIDIIAKNYIYQRILKDKTCIEKLIQLEEFKNKLPNMAKEELETYMKLCDRYASEHPILLNEKIISAYSPKDHFTLIAFYDEITCKDKFIKEFFIRLVEINVNMSFNDIKSLISSFENHLYPENHVVAVILIDIDEFYKLPFDYMKYILDKTKGKINTLQIKTFIAALNLENWRDNLSIEELHKLVLKTTSNSQSLLEKEEIYNYSYDEIVSIINIINNNTHLITIFNNEIITQHLTYQDIMDLIEKYELKKIINFDKFLTALSKVVKDGIAASFYDEICAELDKVTYQNTIIDYLQTCTSIEEFISTLENEFKDDDQIDPNAILILNNPK